MQNDVNRYKKFAKLLAKYVEAKNDLENERDLLRAEKSQARTFLKAENQTKRYFESLGASVKDYNTKYIPFTRMSISQIRKDHAVRCKQAKLMIRVYQKTLSLRFKELKDYITMWGFKGVEI